MILTVEEVKKALFLEPNCDIQEVIKYQQLVDKFVYEKTGYDYGKDLDINQIAKELGELYLRAIKTNSKEKNQYQDYSIGISSLIIDLQNNAKRN